MPSRRASAARPRVSVLRIGHRPGRDPRITTHVALVARAFGAERMFLHPPDPGLAERVAAVARSWGGEFRVEGAESWKSVVKSADGLVVQLTMYGQPLPGVADRARRARSLLVVVGGAKVPAELFGLADLNVSVGNQPHSEVGALAVFLDRVLGFPRPGPWPGARQAIVPQRRGKRIRAVAQADRP